ncbi:hypothetical protein BRADI_3g13733v3 [Brachypodium distachyon]|uniref:Uncharacterized protein n=1 Tax=Brachypodium distachyon TaxID=15368 RepID=A0A2K2CWY2_BRADI|nr:hypothetical protein BRADI_3g13733v3 [Brachypodium distachyon]
MARPMRPSSSSSSPSPASTSSVRARSSLARIRTAITRRCCWPPKTTGAGQYGCTMDDVDAQLPMYTNTHLIN